MVAVEFFSTNQRFFCPAGTTLNILPPFNYFLSPSEQLSYNSFFEWCLLLFFCDREDRQGKRDNNASRDLFTWNYLLSQAERTTA